MVGSLAREAVEHASVPLSRRTVRVVRAVRLNSAHEQHLLSLRDALLSLGIEFRRLGCRPAPRGYSALLDQPLQFTRVHLEPIATSHALARLRSLAVRLDLAARDHLGGEAAHLVEACRPQPLVDAQPTQFIALSLCFHRRSYRKQGLAIQKLKRRLFSTPL